MQNPCYLTNIELRCLHSRFKHLSVQRLQQILEQLDYRVELQAL